MLANIAIEMMTSCSCVSVMHCSKFKLTKSKIILFGYDLLEILSEHVENLNIICSNRSKFQLAPDKT